MIVRKTIAVPDVLDHEIRKLWAILIEKGYDATYSTAINTLVVAGLIAPQLLSPGSKQWKHFFDIINDFLSDVNTIEAINKEEARVRYGENIRVRVRRKKKIEMTEEETSEEWSGDE